MSDVERIGATIARWFVRPSGSGTEEHAVRPAPAVDEPVVVTSGASGALGIAAALALAIAGDGVAVVACWQVPAATNRRGGLAVKGGDAWSRRWRPARSTRRPPAVWW